MPGLSMDAWLPLLREALEQEGEFCFTLRGDSMIPTLPTACTIEVGPLPDRLRLGSLIVFASGDVLIAHRLVARNRSEWITQGDGRLAPDRSIAPDQVIGLVRAAFSGEKQIWPADGEWLVAAASVARYHLLRPARWGRRRLKGFRRSPQGSG